MAAYLKAAAVGLASAVLAFLVVGWSVYSLLWWYEGIDALQTPDANPGVLLGGVWCFGWGVMTGAIGGLATLWLVSTYVYRRQANARA